MAQNPQTMELLDLAALAQIGSARGRKPSPVGFAVVRELGEEDLPALLDPAPLGSTTPLLKELKSHHHTLARLLAEGRRQAEVALITGMSGSRISLLLDDPAFRDLVEYYKVQKDAVYLDVHQRLAAVGTQALEVIQGRLEDAPEGFKNQELLSIVESTFDRSVAPAKGGPSAQMGAAPPVQVNINFVPHEAPPALVIEQSKDD